MLIKEMQSLALDVRVLDENDQEIELKEDADLEANTNFNAIEFDDRRGDQDEYFAPGMGFTQLDENGEEIDSYTNPLYGQEEEEEEDFPGEGE